MELGTFSVSLAVKDIEASKLFDEKLGFADAAERWPPRSGIAGRHTIEVGLRIVRGSSRTLRLQCVLRAVISVQRGDAAPQHLHVLPDLLVLLALVLIQWL